MRTTLDLPDSLFRQAKARAALQGRPLKDLVADGLRLVLASPDTTVSAAPQRTQFPLVRAKDTTRLLTLEEVRAIEDQILEEEAKAHGRLAGH